ncbi:MAG: putative transposase [Planctomycetota bacterium]|jgi:putative transposase
MVDVNVLEGLSMPRRSRLDEPEAHHHVMNRAIGRRTLFESRRDMRVFLFLLAREVRRGSIRVFSYCLMATHFHIYIESTLGDLSSCMLRIQTTYSHYFNRGRRRGGPLFRGRFAF